MLKEKGLKIISALGCQQIERTAKNFINTEEVRGLLRIVPFRKVPRIK